MNTLKQLLALMLLAVIVAEAQGPYRTVTVREIQQVPFDSLLVADGLQNSQPTRWRLQTSPFLASATVPRETVEVVVQCIVPAKVINYTATGWTMVLRDTAETDGAWSYMFARANVADSVALTNDGFLNVERGDIFRIRGWVDEFPVTSMNSITQFVPVPGLRLDIIDSKPVGPPIKKTVGDFFRGLHPGGEVRYSTGEPFEGAVVELTNLTVNGTWSPGAGRTNLTLVDDDGNMTLTYDASGHFTTLQTRQLSSYTSPPFGARIDTLRGVVFVVSGQQNSAGYIIAPMFPGDMTVGVTRPAVTTHRREPVIVGPTDTAHISVLAYRQTGGLPLNHVLLFRSINNGPWQADTMRAQVGDSTYRAAIPPAAENTFVRYFVKVFDTDGNAATLASSAFGGAGSDTSRGTFFYTVLNRPLTIYDVQWTPFTNGRTAYLGAVATVEGIVTVDTSDIGTSPLNAAGTHAWYIQASSEPWNGLWIAGPDSLLAHLRKGMRVRVTGTVQENFDVTRLGDITAVEVISSGNAVPEPVLLATGNFGPTIGNGNRQAEQWEGMLVRMNNVTVTNIWPVFSDITEYEINDGTGPMLVRRDGTNHFSNVPGDTSLGMRIIREGDRFSFIQGVVHYSFNRYKIVPRSNSDFGDVATSVYASDQPFIPGEFFLAQNYPNPFNPATVIEYNIPARAHVTLKVYNMLGQEVLSLIDEVQDAGRYAVTAQAGSLSSGMYFYRLSAGSLSQVKRMVLLK